MTEAETGEGWELRLGDCACPVSGLRSLGSVDHVITDPPYSPRVHSGVRSSNFDRSYENFSQAPCVTRRKVDLGFEHLCPDLRKLVAHEFGRLVRKWCLVFSDAESVHLWIADLEDSGLSHEVVGVWRRLNGAPRFHGQSPAPSWEAIEIAYRKRGWNGGGKQAYWEHPVVNNHGGRSRRLHTAQKPLGLMTDLVRAFTEPNDLICDPFAGSASTGVACVREGRKFIGWERDPDIFAIAVQRLRAAREQFRLAL